MEGTMEITIWSLLAEDSSGCECFSVPSSTAIGDLLIYYCSEKGIQASSNYILCNSANKLLNARKSLKAEHIRHGEVLMLTAIDKNEEKNSFGNWRMVTSLSLLIGTVGLLYICYMFLVPLPVPDKHGIVIDAGSSHSHLFLYNWYHTPSDSTDSLRIIHECYMPGGIAQYRSQTEDLLSYFQKCLEEVKSLVPQHQLSETPLILGATAGMRILREYDPEGANNILSEIRRIFMSETAFKVEKNDVFILSGQQEGINGWTAINFLYDNFEPDDDPESILSALDLGGASVQVSTYLNQPGNWPTVNVSLFNSTYPVCSKSFMCYGIVKAHYRYAYLLSSKIADKSSTVIPNPCLPSGMTTIFTKMDTAEPCIINDKEDVKGLNVSHVGYKEVNYISKYITYYIKKHSNTSNGIPVKRNKPKITSFPTYYDHLEQQSSRNLSNHSKRDALFTMKGVSDAQACRKIVLDLFDFKLCNKMFAFGDCLNHDHIPPYSGELVVKCEAIVCFICLVGEDWYLFNG